MNVIENNKLSQTAKQKNKQLMQIYQTQRRVYERENVNNQFTRMSLSPRKNINLQNMGNPLAQRYTQQQKSLHEKNSMSS